MTKSKIKKENFAVEDRSSNPNILKDFYSDLDRKTEKKGCSFALIIIFMIVLLGLIVACLFYFKSSFKLGVKYFNQEQVANGGEGITGKIQGDLAATPNGSEAQVKVTEQELSYYLGVDQSDFPLKKANLKIRQSGIALSGRTRDSFFSIPVKIIVKPKIENGKFKVEIDNVQGSFVTLPKVIKDGLNASLDDVVNKRTSLINNFEFTSASLQDGYLILTGVKKSV